VYVTKVSGVGEDSIFMGIFSPVPPVPDTATVWVLVSGVSSFRANLTSGVAGCCLQPPNSSLVAVTQYATAYILIHCIVSDGMSIFRANHAHTAGPQSNGSTLSCDSELTDWLGYKHEDIHALPMSIMAVEEGIVDRFVTFMIAYTETPCRCHWLVSAVLPLFYAA
jgi:hypothetical protein